MNKNQLIKELSKNSNLTQKNCNTFINAFTEIVKKNLKDGNTINITGFGKWEIKNRKSRNSFNPQTKCVIKLPETKVPTFKPGKVLKKAII